MSSHRPPELTSPDPLTISPHSAQPRGPAYLEDILSQCFDPRLEHNIIHLPMLGFAAYSIPYAREYKVPDRGTRKKPITAVTALIERLTKDEYDIEDLSDLPTLIEAIQIQRSTGPTEAARAIRKKLKYGNPHRQIRALIILDDLIQNAGPGFQKNFADEMLLERLRFMVTDPLVDPEVKAKCSSLYRQWAVAYSQTPGMQNVATLYKQLPQRKKAPNKATSKVLQETERLDEDGDDEEEDGPFQTRSRGPSVTSPTARPRGPSITNSFSSAPSHRRQSSAKDFNTAASQMAYQPPAFIANQQAQAKKDRKSAKGGKVKPFNLEKEKSQINQVLALASIEATGLLNAMKLINREKERVSENPNTRKRFETCKHLRRQTFRYCSLVMNEGYLGPLLNANDQLSDALILYEQLDRGFDYDSDSEDYDDPDAASAHAAHQNSADPTNGVRSGLGGMSLEDKAPNMPPRPPVAAQSSTDKGKGRTNEESEEEDEEDDDNPFADRNAVG